jgi:hypothetical protein
MRGFSLSLPSGMALLLVWNVGAATYSFPHLTARVTRTARR